MFSTSAELNASRTADEVALEAANHFLTMYFTNNPQCADELDAFYASQEAMRLLAAGNDDVETFLLLTDVKQWIKTLTGREWKN